jgi:hypothetical protein
LSYGKLQYYLLSFTGVNVVSLTLRKERRLRVFDNRELRRMFGPRRNEVTSEWRKLQGC